MRRLVIGFTLFCFVTTQTTALAQPHAEGTAAGQAANGAAKSLINGSTASQVVPAYTTTPPETAYYGEPGLAGQANAQLTACALTPMDPVCQAQLGALGSANTPRVAVSPYDPSVLAARRIAANPAATLENISTYYSGCQVDTVATTATETRVCRQYSGTTAQSCAQTLSVAIARTSSCNPGDWFAHAASGRTGLDVQCIPDRSLAQQHFRVTDDGAVLAYVDLDMSVELAFPQKVATLPRSGAWWTWLSSGENGLWVADNACTGDSCQLTAMVAEAYRLICTDDGTCVQEPPFLKTYAACPSGTQSGDNILPGWLGGVGEASALDEATCYAPSESPTTIVGYDGTGTVQGLYWVVNSQRAVTGWHINPAFGAIPQMVLSYERPHTTVTETDQWDDQCPSLQAGGRCAVAQAARCVDGPATKTVNGAAVTRDCWRYETALSCTGNATDECAPLAHAGCTPTGSACRQTNAATGACEITENTYGCPVPAGSTATVSNCPANVFCIDGSCFSTAYTGDADFARSMSLMEAAREAGVYLDTDHMQVFKGEANRCRDRLLKNCCYSDSAGAGMTNQSLFGTGSRLVFDVLMNANDRQFLYQGLQALLMGGGFSGSFTTYGVTVAVNGTALPAGTVVLYSGDSLVLAFDPWSLAIAVVIYVAMSMMSCDEDEGLLAMKEGAHLCHTIGTWCSDCIEVLGHCVACIEHTTGKCCFNSMLSRIVNEQGRGQVGKGWGSAKRPDCSGFTLAQLQELDFAAMDLSEFYASIVPTLPNATVIQSGNTARAANCYYGQGQCP